jgi:hypothetical protein
MPRVPRTNSAAPDLADLARRSLDEEVRFCPLCDVALDLHDGPDTCRSAEMKADLLSRFWSMSGGAR